MSIFKSFIICLCFLIFALFIPRVFAAEVDVLHITSNYFPEVAHLTLSTDSKGDISKVSYQSWNGSTLVKDVTVSPRELMGNGFAVKNVAGITLVILKMPQYSPVKGGEVEVSYCFNAIKGTFLNFSVYLERQGDEWQIIDSDKRVVREFFIIPNYVPMLKTPVGINSIELRYK